MTQKIDRAEYESGRNAFKRGTTLLEIVERIQAANASPMRSAEDKAMSFALGFADEVLDALRKGAKA